MDMDIVTERHSEINPPQKLSDVVDSGIVKKSKITRTCFSLEEDELYKLKMYALKTKKPLARVLRDLIRTLPD